MTGASEAPETRAVRPLIALQEKWSALPGPDNLVLEAIASREGHHLLSIPLPGAWFTIGLASLLGGAPRATSRARFRFR